MQRIRELRKRDNMSQEALAGRLGVSRSAVAMWEAGRSEPDTDKLIALAAFFRVSVDYLLQQDLRDGTAPGLRNGGYADIGASRELHEVQRGGGYAAIRGNPVVSEGNELRGGAATQRGLGGEAVSQDLQESEQEAADIRLIERARRSMTPVEKDRMMKILKASFEEYFKDDN